MEVTTGCVLSDNGATEKIHLRPVSGRMDGASGRHVARIYQNGRNATGGAYGNINSVHTSDNASYRGFRMYVQEWKKGKWVYFPSQGLRTAEVARGVTGCVETITLHRPRQEVA